MWCLKDTFKCYGQVLTNFCPYIVYTHACTTTPKHTDLSSYTPLALLPIGFPSIDLSALSALHQLLHYFLFIYHWMNPCSLFPAHPFFFTLLSCKTFTSVHFLFALLSLTPQTPHHCYHLALLLLGILLNANKWALISRMMNFLFLSFSFSVLILCLFAPLILFIVFFSSRQCVTMSHHVSHFIKPSLWK